MKIGPTALCMVTAAVTAFAFADARLLVIAAGAVVLATGLANPAFGAMLLAGLEVTRASLVVEELHGFPSFIVPYAILLLVVGLVRRPAASPFGPEVMVPVVVLACYGVVLLSGVLYASRPTVVWAGAQAYVKELTVVAALVVLVRTPAMLRTAVWGAVLAGGLLGALNSWQHLTGTFDTTMLGFARPVFGVVDGVSRHRIGGPLADPNAFAQTMVVVLALAAERAWHERQWLFRAAASTSAVVSALTVVLTSSRGGWLALGAVCLAFAWRFRPRASTVVAAVAVLALLVVVSPARYRSLAASLVRPVIGGAERPDGSLAVRSDALAIGLAMFVDHPVLGVGWRQYDAHYLAYARELGIDTTRQERSAHGLVLAVADESGLVGLGAFGAIVVLALTSVARARRRLLAAGDTTAGGLVEGVQIALVGLLVAAVFLPLATPQVLWLMIALSFSVRQLTGKPAALELPSMVARP